MIKKEQLSVVDYKLSPIYSQKINELALDSKVSFDNFQTPGWSSIMHTETSPDPSLAKGQLNHHKVLEKLNRLKDVDLSQSNFSRIRVPDSTKSNNILIYQQQKHLLKNSESNLSRKENFNERNSLQVQSHPQRLSTQKRIATGGSLKNSSASRISKPIVTQRETAAISHNQSVQATKRFNHITVHEHLYLDGIKQNSKRIIEQILDQQYRKEKILPFHPQINAKSQQLAEVKFSRVQEKMQIQNDLKEDIKISETASKVQKQSRIQQKQQNKYNILNRLFYFLSKGESVISKQTIKLIVEQLPLMCIKALQKVLEQIYAGTTYTWLQFLSEMNNRKVVINKQGLISIFEKWQIRLDKKAQASKVDNER